VAEPSRPRLCRRTAFPMVVTSSVPETFGLARSVQAEFSFRGLCCRPLCAGAPARTIVRLRRRFAYLGALRQVQVLLHCFAG
jgi:hypothetical protein